MKPSYVGGADNELYIERVKSSGNEHRRWHVFEGRIGKGRFIGAVTLYYGATWPVARRPYTDELIGDYGTVDSAAEAVRDDALARERKSGQTVAQLAGKVGGQSPSHS